MNETVSGVQLVHRMLYRGHDIEAVSWKVCLLDGFFLCTHCGHQVLVNPDTNPGRAIQRWIDQHIGDCHG